MLQTMAYDTPYIEKSPTKKNHTAVSLYVLAEVIVYTIILSSSILVNFIAQEMILKYM